MSRSALLPAVPAAAVLAAVVLAGCGQPPPPEVTFAVDDHSARTGPIRHCDIELTTCAENDSAVAVLRVPTGRPVRISVPDSIADTPWQVVFRYRRGAEQAGGRSEVFPPGRQQEYTLRVPEGGALVSLEVQQYGAPDLAGGEPSFPIRAAWVLAAEGAEQPAR
ncbi:MAG: DUF2771 family protein [Pseudonocardiaceae bacterium]